MSTFPGVRKDFEGPEGLRDQPRMRRISLLRPASPPRETTVHTTTIFGATKKRAGKKRAKASLACRHSTSRRSLAALYGQLDEEDERRELKTVRARARRDRE